MIAANKSSLLLYLLASVCDCDLALRDHLVFLVLAGPVGGQGLAQTPLLLGGAVNVLLGGRELQ